LPNSLNGQYMNSLLLLTKWEGQTRNDSWCLYINAYSITFENWFYFISLRAHFDWLFYNWDFRFKLYYRRTLTFTTSGIVSIQLINCRIWKFMYKYYPTKWLYKYTYCLLSCEIYEPKSFMRMVCAWAVLQ
jgi:hypothetical protein